VDTVPTKVVVGSSSMATTMRGTKRHDTLLLSGVVKPKKPTKKKPQKVVEEEVEVEEEEEQSEKEPSISVSDIPRISRYPPLGYWR
jgi:hypothetical protein